MQEYKGIDNLSKKFSWMQHILTYCKVQRCDSIPCLVSEERTVYEVMEIFNQEYSVRQTGKASIFFACLVV